MFLCQLSSLTMQVYYICQNCCYCTEHESDDGKFCLENNIKESPTASKWQPGGGFYEEIIFVTEKWIARSQEWL